MHVILYLVQIMDVAKTELAATHASACLATKASTVKSVKNVENGDRSFWPFFFLKLIS